MKINVGDIPPIAFLETLGIELTEIGERHAVMTVTVDDRHLNYRGGAHGGLL
ncbi:MAG: phenylacetic acid degradation protein, partial [Deltaproteobacteria bacterium]|nr:phenylacetic acid degradation protein [Deltaproteobacteria bacterium]